MREKAKIASMTYFYFVQLYYYKSIIINLKAKAECLLCFKMLPRDQSVMTEKHHKTSSFRLVCDTVADQTEYLLQMLAMLTCVECEVALK
jgi:hypothetical protein